MPRLATYLTALGLLLALAGYCLFLLRGVDLRNLLIPLTGIFYTAVFVYQPMVRSVLAYGMRRFIPVAVPVAALMEARRVTKSTGRIAILTWGNPQGMEAAALVTALGPLLPSPPPGSPVPFALSDESALKAFAKRAGLTALEVSDLACEWYYNDLHTALRGLGSSGVAARAAEHTSAEAVANAHEAALAPFRRDNGSYRLGASFRWLLAAP